MRRTLGEDGLGIARTGLVEEGPAGIAGCCNVLGGGRQA